MPQPVIGASTLQWSTAFLGETKTASTEITRRIHGTGIYTYMKGQLLW